MKKISTLSYLDPLRLFSIRKIFGFFLEDGGLALLFSGHEPLTIDEIAVSLWEN